MKKFIVSLIILLIFAGAVFVLGWLEIFVPLDNYGVLISKTSGVSPDVIQAGNFTWRWERLIPTNSQIRTFDAYPQTFSKTIQGTLPSSEIYKNMLEGNPDFSYSFSIDIVMNIIPDRLPNFVNETGAKDDAKLQEYLNNQADSIARSAIQYILENSANDIDFVIEASLSNTELIDGIHASSRYADLDIASIHINNAKLPDLTMYDYAKTTYEIYQETIRQTLRESAELQGTQAAEDYLELERFSRLGRILADYPSLIDFMAVTSGSISFDLPDNPQINDVLP
ncbi:MAG: hypothetical protein R3Y36_08025 [Spirochaetales bacterium]